MKNYIVGFIAGILGMASVAAIAFQYGYPQAAAIQWVKDHVNIDTMGVGSGELLISWDRNPWTESYCQVVLFDAATIAKTPRLPSVPISTYENRYRNVFPATSGLSADQRSRCFAAFHGFTAYGNATAIQLYDGDAWRDVKLWQKLTGATVAPGTPCDEGAVRVFESDGTEWHYATAIDGRRGLVACSK